MDANIPKFILRVVSLMREGSGADMEIGLADITFFEHVGRR